MIDLFAVLRSLTLPGGAAAGDPRLVLGPDIPAVLTAFYAPSFGSVYAVFLAYSNATDYEYTAWIKATVVGGGYTAKAQGWVLAGVVVHNELAFLPSGVIPANTIVGPSLGSPAAGFQYNFTGVSGASLDPINDPNYSGVNIANDVDFCIDSQVSIPMSAPRGLKAEGTGGNVGGIALSAGAEVAMPAASWAVEPTFNFKIDRLYRVICRVHYIVGSAVDNISVLRVRKGSASVVGTVFAAWFLGNPSSAAANPAGHTLIGYVKNTSGANVSTALSLTNQWANGAASSSLFSNAAAPILLTIEDVGRPEDHPTLAGVTASV